MSGSPRALTIPDALLAAAYRHARATFPAECVGWLVGPAGGDAVSALRPCENAYDAAAHPTANDRSVETAYALSVADCRELDRAMSSAAPPRVLYHSHPNGRAYFSATDREVALGGWDEPVYPLQQLVVGIDAACVVEARLFAWDADEREFVVVATYAGAAA
ncbi:MAG: hypothetical protein EXR73_05775 [Myxococcales bacterium]|nr:hypothetical protein [Myxococcales bacterium]